MLRKTATALAALATTAALGIGATPAQAATTTTTTPVVRCCVTAEPRLVDIDVTPRRHVDRITLQFRGGLPDLDARYVRVARLDNGRRVRLPGNAILLLTLDPARARDLDRDLQDVDLDNVIAFRVIGDRRGTVRVAVALRERARVRVLERGNRITLDIDNDLSDDLRRR